VHIPFETLQSLVTKMQQFQQTSDLLRRNSLFVILVRRLLVKEIQGQMVPKKDLWTTPSQALSATESLEHTAELGSSHSGYADLRVTQSSARLFVGFEKQGEYSSKSPSRHTKFSSFVIHQKSCSRNVIEDVTNETDDILCVQNQTKRNWHHLFKRPTAWEF
jgi:hypothetical protein